MHAGVNIFAKLAITVAVGVACGLGFKRLKVPAGYMVGAFVGCSMERDDLRRLKGIGCPVAVMLAACLVLMLADGACIYLVSPSAS